MKRALLPFIAVLLVAVGFGGYFLGRLSDRQLDFAAASRAANAGKSTLSSVPQASVSSRDSVQPAISSVGSKGSPTMHPTVTRESMVQSPRAAASDNGSASRPKSDSGNDELRKKIDATFDTMDADDPNTALQSSLVAAHQLIQTQAVDPSWGPVVDQAISDRLSDDLGSQFNVDAIDCRTNICELRVWGYLPAGHEGVDSFQKEIFDLQQQGWFDQQGLKYETLGMSGVGHAGPAVFLVYLTRK